MNRVIRVGMVRFLLVSFLWNTSGQAQDANVACDEQCQATRAAQDPTAEVNGVFLDTTIDFGSSSDETLYNLEIQGVRTLASAEWGALVLRGIVPVLGVPVPDATTLDLGTDFGISDTVLQLFYVPNDRIGPFSYGFGPQVSLSTHSDDAQKAAGFGAGLAGGIFGFSGSWAFGGLANHLWGEDDYSTTTLQPIVYYNFESERFGDWFLGYNAQISYDWSADHSAEAWTVPLGLTAGKTVLQQSGRAVTYNLGAYKLLESQNDTFDWQLRFAVNILSQ
ncbi:MAG: hypothetical protein AAGB07_00095 [Pseudomonadota bacterium]